MFNQVSHLLVPFIQLAWQNAENLIPVVIKGGSLTLLPPHTALSPQKNPIIVCLGEPEISAEFLMYFQFESTSLHVKLSSGQQNLSPFKELSQVSLRSSTYILFCNKIILLKFRWVYCYILMW